MPRVSMFDAYRKRSLLRIRIKHGEGASVSYAIGGKFSFLMDVTGLSNGEVAKAINMSSSYVSHICRGERSLARSPKVVELASERFAEGLKTNDQLDRVAKAMGVTAEDLPRDAQLARALEQWLSNGRPMEGDGLGGGENDPGRQWLAKVSAPSASGKWLNGVQGFRVACLNLLCAAQKEASQEKTVPHELLLYSSEDLSWLTGDASFARAWSYCMQRLAREGTQITVIHVLTRTVGEMFEGLRRWIPVYAAGTVTSLYCPRLRDGLFQGSLLVAPGVYAVRSTSRGGLKYAAVNTTQDRASVDTLEKQFHSLEEDCVNLGSTYLAGQEEEVARELETVRSAGHKVIHFGPRPLTEEPGDAVWAASFVAKGGEILDIVGVGPGEAQKQEVERSYEAARQFADDSAGYQVRKVKTKFQGMDFLVAEGHGALVTFLDEPHVTISAHEPRVTEAIAEYLQRLAL